MALLSEFDLKLAAQVDAHQLFLETLYAALFQSNPEIFAAFESTIYAKLKSLSLGARYGESSLMAEAEIKRHVNSILRGVKITALPPRV
jgi:hypothetical protein